MSKFLIFIDYLVEVFRSKDALNEHLSALPWAVQEHALGIGEWIKQLMGWG